MKKKDITKPVMLYAAEEIYLKISEIKLKNTEISLVEAVEIYIGSESYELWCKEMNQKNSLTLGISD